MILTIDPRFCSSTAFRMMNLSTSLFLSSDR